MPACLPPLSRRRFLAGSVAVASGLVFGDALWSAADQPAADPHRFALLSDVHIAANLAAVLRNVNMAQHLKKVVAEVAALSPRPAWSVINGDLALTSGESGDYGTLLELLKPMRQAGLPVHLALGNHDHRDRFRAALPESTREATAPMELQAYVVESPRANWFVLDSLVDTNKVPGTVGEPQLKWLEGALDARKDKPAIVMVHHNPDREDPTRGGLTDTVAVMDFLAGRRQAKALIFGHTHRWSVKEENGIHLINLPAVAYVFQAGDPSGWVDVKLSDEGGTLELRCVDPTHKQHGEKHDLKWRQN
jgi:3',5'-cyclic AMP phosphodiesterase CpdA